MTVEMNKSPSVRLTPGQEIKLAKPATELYIGQVLKTVVITALSNDQVLININGQNLNAQSSHHFAPGELLEVKVVANQDETILEVQHGNSSLSMLQNALLWCLPKQAPATTLLNILNQLSTSEQLPAAINQQIKALLRNIVPVSQLTQQLIHAMSQSGLFLESHLLQWQSGMSVQKLKADFKGQCLKLLHSLTAANSDSFVIPDLEIKGLEHDPLPLPGAIPQPLQHSNFCLLDHSSETLQALLKDQLSRVLARITAHQVNHLAHDNKDGFLIMLDLPVKALEHFDVIPLMIRQHKAAPMQPSKWSLSFAVHLTHLGDIQATVSLSGHQIDVKINAQDRTTVDLLNQHQPDINTLLQASALHLREWNVHLGLEDNQIDVHNLRLLDLRI